MAAFKRAPKMPTDRIVTASSALPFDQTIEVETWSFAFGVESPVVRIGDQFLTNLVSLTRCVCIGDKNLGNSNDLVGVYWVVQNLL